MTFFWAFFHSSFNPSIKIGGVWPSAFMVVLNSWKVLLLNTDVLLSSDFFNYFDKSFLDCLLELFNFGISIAKND